ncbi:ABC transporter ATP-binding protein [bacterium]|nr:ABC transporter ATP-binding protein [bacterium]
MIVTKDLNKTYIIEDIETTALKNINLTIHRGEFVAVMGPSGCGKTTLLNVLGLLDVPSEGEHYFQSQEVSQLSERDRAAIRKSNIGFVFQSFNLIMELSVYENIELPLVYLHLPLSERRERVLEIMDRLQLSTRGRYFPQQLSGGQQQRVAVARAIVGNPSLLLADEPTGNLDSQNGREIMELLTKLNEMGTTIIMVTHSITLADYGQRIIHLFDGHVVTENMKDQLMF